MRQVQNLIREGTEVELKLITNDLLKAGDWAGIEARVRKTVDLIAKIRRELA